MAQTNNTRFRGQGTAVGAIDSTEAMLDAAGMHWTTAKRPMLIQGLTSTRPSAFKALCRSDDGYELGVSTEDYKPVHNQQIVECMKRIADAGEMTITHLGTLDHGRRVFASCDMHGDFDLRPANGQLTPERALAIHHQRLEDLSLADRTKLDTTKLHGIMGSGHVPGISFTFEGMAERLVCLNGAKISRSAKSRFSLRHLTEFDRDAEQRFRDVISCIKSEFVRYREDAQKLQGAKWDADVTRAFCMELLAPKLFAEALERSEFKCEPSLIGARNAGYSLDSVIARSALYLGACGKVEPMKNKVTRPAARVLELVNTSPGADIAPGTAWNAYNAVTYFVDHERGRGEASAVESSLFGEGSNLKQDALALAMAYTEAIYA
jgi:hypothetical protein